MSRYADGLPPPPGTYYVRTGSEARPWANFQGLSGRGRPECGAVDLVGPGRKPPAALKTGDRIPQRRRPGQGTVLSRVDHDLSQSASFWLRCGMAVCNEDTVERFRLEHRVFGSSGSLTWVARGLARLEEMAFGQPKGRKIAAAGGI